VGASPLQVFFTAVWPAVLPQVVSNHLYIWEFNIRDSTILGMVGAWSGTIDFRSRILVPVESFGDDIAGGGCARVCL
jgi:hypothetical protein